jgi:hypothetical protein
MKMKTNMNDGGMEKGVAGGAGGAARAGNGEFRGWSPAKPKFLSAAPSIFF